jgi:hypothetical protein
MRKLKTATCLDCNKRIKRHDTSRIKVAVGINNGKTSYRYSHTDCRRGANDNLVESK